LINFRTIFLLTKRQNALNLRSQYAPQRGDDVLGNRLKSLLQSGYPAIGSWIGFADPYSVELMADVGFDWLLIDTEHFPIDRRGLQTILIAMKGSETTPVVRVPNNSLEYFQTALDIGAQGVVVPMVSSRSDAELAVGCCRYPPAGSRGFAPVRASRYFQEVESYARRANDEIALIVQIETPKAVENIDEILALPGIDGIFIGPSDLASFMNFPANTAHPEVTAVVDRLIDRACARSVPFGLPSWTPEECRHYIERGARLMTIGGDLHFLSNGARSTLSNTRTLLGKRAPVFLDQNGQR
jgi:2-keto-3-deoxy-L-rhamnonate aldolase RhmA